MTKVLILIQGKDVAASRYRILQYIPYLEDHGVRCHVMEFPDTLKEYFSLYKVLPQYDCVFVQRKRFHFPFLSLFRKKARKIVYDLDDAVMYRNSLGKSPYSRTRERRFAGMVRVSNTVIAGNSFPKEKALAYTPDVVMIPTSIPIERYSLKDYTQKKGKVTIGWIGDHGSIHYLKRLQGVWEEIGRRYQDRVELKIICDTFFDCDNIFVRKINWSEGSEVEELKDIDIGVMPLIDDPWSWGKCGLKILQYCGVGVPVVCTPVGVNRDVVKDNLTGYWATDKDEWVEKISLLIEDSGKRKEMGIAGRKVIEEGYTKEVNEVKLFELLKA